jgi:DTW domain-containing protein YfiP
LLRPDLDYVLIFPRHRDPESTQSEPAPELNARVFAERRAARPDAKPTIVLLDGTWAQCSRMSRRIEAIARMDAYRLPPGPNGHWGVRRASEPERVSTFEAAIRVMELAGELEVAAAMQTYFDSIAARMQFMKGKLPRPEVPEAWIAERQARFSG